MPPDVIPPVAAGRGVLPIITKRQDPKEKFYRRFQVEVTTIQEQIDHLGSMAVVGGERQDAVDSVLGAISRLSHEVSDASDYVPAYDLRTYAQAIKALTDRLNETTTKLAPRSRFQFKSRNQATRPNDSISSDPRLLANANLVDRSSPTFGGPVSHPEAADNVSDLPAFPRKPSSPLSTSTSAEDIRDYNKEMAQPRDTHIRTPSFSTAREIAITGQKGLHIILPSTASRATSSGRLTDMHGCVVDMSRAAGTATSGGTPFANLALRDISRSLVVAGTVDGPVHITNVKDSILVVAARQVRIHECSDVDIYLYCSSHPIVEDCSALRFAPLPEAFPAPGERDQNQWDQVDDFKWLKAEKSPNWSVLAEEGRLADHIWEKTLPGETGKDLGDILKAIGIPM